MEYLDLYDKNKKLTGEIIERKKLKTSMPKDRYLNVVQIFIQSSDGKFLIQYTSKEKGNEIATTGGFVQAGQTSDQTITREVKEELGVDISNEDYKLIDTILFKQVFIDVYYLKKDYNLDDFILQKEEVEEVKWLTIDEIKNLIELDKFRKSNVISFNLVLDYLNKNK